MIKIAINGFGRIGKNFLRCIMQDENAKKKIDVRVINVAKADIEATAYAFKYDSVLRRYCGNVQYKDSKLIIDDKTISLISELNPERLSWSNFQIDWVVDCSGKFTKRSDAEKHLNAGAKAVLISAPTQGEDITIIPGVNLNLFDKKTHKIVSLASCTTNAFATMLHVLLNNFSIKEIFMTTIHAYTNTQALLDVDPHGNDFRRSRAAALNIVPTSTGAMEVIDRIFPRLAGKVRGHALRVPVASVSLIDLTAILEEDISKDKINEVYSVASKTYLKKILDFSNEPLVSSDYIENSYSVVIDSLLTETSKNVTKIFGWYDNEWGYSERMKDFLMEVSI